MNRTQSQRLKTNIFVISGDLWHPAALVRQGLAPLRASGYEFEFSENGEPLSGERIGKFSVAILARANLLGESQPWLAPQSQGILPDYVRSGNALLVLHGGTVRHEILPVMHSLIGGAFVRHPEQCAVTIEPKDKGPIAEGAASFTVRDEHYFVQTEPDAKIFLQSRSQYGAQPAGWTRLEGRGRVCVLTPGHNLEVWLHPGFQKLLLNSLHWTAPRA